MENLQENTQTILKNSHHLNDEKLFSIKLENDKISISEDMEEEGMNREALFHNHYAIYLYCTVERGVAECIVNGDIGAIPIPLNLYETKEISQAMGKNVRQKVTLKVVVNLFVNQNQLYYDQLTMNKDFKDKIKKHYNFKNDTDLLKGCVYYRRIAKCEETGGSVIEYTVNNPGILMSPQYANII